MKYYNPLVDKKPVEVKIIQYHKDRVEITRDLNGSAGFWVNKNELLPYFISGSCKGEIYSVCGKDATNKLGEGIPFDDPNKMRHNLTAYVCREHFTMIVGGC